MEEIKCVFCAIVAGKLPATLLWQDERVLAIPDIAPRAPVHQLIVYKKHIPNILALGDEAALFGESLLRATNALVAANDAKENFRLLINTGALSGQTVFHLHCHFMSP